MARGGGAKSPCVVVAGARLQKVIATKFSIRDLPALPAPGFIRRWQRREHLEVSGRMKGAAMVTEKERTRQRWPHRALHRSRGHTDGLRARLIKTFTAHIDHLERLTKLSEAALARRFAAGSTSSTTRRDNDARGVLLAALRQRASTHASARNDRAAECKQQTDPRSTASSCANTQLVITHIAECALRGHTATDFSTHRPQEEHR